MRCWARPRKSTIPCAALDSIQMVGEEVPFDEGTDVQLTFMERWEPFGRVIWMDVPLKRDVSEVWKGRRSWDGGGGDSRILKSVIECELNRSIDGQDGEEDVNYSKKTIDNAKGLGKPTWYSPWRKLCFILGPFNCGSGGMFWYSSWM